MVLFYCNKGENKWTTNKKEPLAIIAATGEVLYLNNIENKQDDVVLAINIDSPCHLDSQIAISTYNMDEQKTNAVVELQKKYSKIVIGENRYAGDHCAFAFRGIPCIAVASSDFFLGGLRCTHMPSDTFETVDLNLIEPTANYLVELIHFFDKPEERS